MAGETGPISAPLAINMTIAGFFAIACYNSVELLVSLFSRFKRYKGLYFWSMLTATLGLLLHAIVVLLRYYSLGPNFPLAVLTCIGWWGMVTGQSLVLYSRLHLIVPYKEKARWVLFMIITNFFILHVPVTVLFLGSNLHKSTVFIHSFKIYERIQLAGFCIQESIISGLYIWEAVQGLKWVLVTRGPQERNVIRHLVIVNIFAILLDVSLLVTQYTGHFQIQTTYKPVVYSIKLKMEFSILNKLLRLLRHGGVINGTSSNNDLPSQGNPRLDSGNQSSRMATDDVEIRNISKITTDSSALCCHYSLDTSTLPPPSNSDPQQSNTACLHRSNA